MTEDYFSDSYVKASKITMLWLRSIWYFLAQLVLLQLQLYLALLPLYCLMCSHSHNK